MTIKSIQKVIKVGSSLAVTLPARDARSIGIVAGQEVDILVKPRKTLSAKKPSNLAADYEAFKVQYGKTLKNLAER